MEKSPANLRRFSMAAEVYSTTELQKLYDISKEEAESFRPFARIYTRDSMIIHEGDKDKTLYLIRGGSVGIYRKIGDKQERIATIEAVNFVGEMSLINDAPRTATVIALSEKVLIYAIPSPNLHLILSNPTWAEMLITRFSKDLNQANSQLVNATATIQNQNAEILHLKEENSRIKQTFPEHRERIRRLVNNVLVLATIIRDQSVLRSRGWYFVEVVNDVIKHLAADSFPDIHFSPEQANYRWIVDHVDAVQKVDTRPNISSVYEILRASLEE